MPSVSKKQKVAMKIACAGKSSIGIPKKVGCEYAKADAGTGSKGSGKFKGSGKRYKVGRSS